MNRKRRLSHHILIVMGVVTLLSLSIPSHAGAQGIVRGDNLPAGTTIHGDGVFYGPIVRIDGDVDGDVFAIGGEVEINGSVSGSLMVLGDRVAVNGEVGGTAYAAAVQFDLAPEANVSRNLYFAGLSLNTQEGAQIGRDLYTATMGAQLAGAVDGEVRAIIGPVEFFYLIMRKIDQTGWLGSGVAPSGGAAAQDHDLGRAAKGPGVAFAGLAPAMIAWDPSSFQQPGGIDWEGVGNWLLERLREWFVLLVIGLVGLWLAPEWIPGSARFLQSKPLPATGWGLLGVVISFNLAGVVILMLIVLLAAGFFLGIVTLWELAWSFMAIGGFSLGLVSTIFALFVIYISKAIVAFLVGGMILKRIAPATAGYKALALVIGLVVYVLLAAIPILGWVVGLLVTALGLGAAWLFYQDRRAGAKAPELEANAEMATI
jgi:cytoskeletal protein CcmA (bactofilin family)